MPAAAPAMPVKPRRPAMIAITKNVILHPSISLTSSYNKEKLNRLSKLLNGVSKNACINTMIMKCTQQCIYKDICILAKEGLAPTDYPCPIEKKLIMDLEFDIVKSLEIDQNSRHPKYSLKSGFFKVKIY